MLILENHSLANLNTLALGQSARYFATIESPADLSLALCFAREHALPWMILGGGSNLVLSQDYPGLVIHNQLKGIEWLEEDGDNVRIKVAAGEHWHALVSHCLDKGWYGLENLALIPGTAGAAPVQNIGAYGVELCDVFYSLEAWDEQQQQCVTLDKSRCAFAYRDSVFKQQPGRFVILSLILQLSTAPRVNIHYQSLQDYFSPRGPHPMLAEDIRPRNVFDAVVAIRKSKLPDPAQMPNAGSFFKNPLVTADQYAALLKQYPALVSYPAAGGQRKLAAGWLIEQAGWKGKTLGHVGVHPQQALVLVHHGQGSGAELLQFATLLREDIRQRYGVTLEMEPVVV
jgi:UDP-N-acetylmuramate dehydrogenase